MLKNICMKAERIQQYLELLFQLDQIKGGKSKIEFKQKL